LTDQLLAVRKTVSISIPVNILLGLAALLVAIHSGEAFVGLIWFITSLIINVLRLSLCRAPVRMRKSKLKAVNWGCSSLGVVGHLYFHTLLALLSGLVWAFIPALCDWYTSPQTLFYLTVVCGITAGAVTHGFAYARIPLCFIIPPLMSVWICLIIAGGFERYILAATVLLYLAALVRGTRVGQALVINDSKLKNEATALSHSLERANYQKALYAKEMECRSVTDQLTGLLNRRGFTEVLERMHAEGRQGCLILLDLDGFKSVNDAYGHKSGDRVLVEVARRLKEAMDSTAIFARLGGDEFAILIDEAILEEDAEVRALRLITAISIPFSKLDSGRVGISAGIYVGKISEIDEVMIYADTALYAAKKEGRNRYRLFDEKLRRQAQLNRDVERDIE
jgi:diguanylate cyclase (GGDEF)-like protein